MFRPGNMLPTGSDQLSTAGKTLNQDVIVQTTLGVPPLLLVGFSCFVVNEINNRCTRRVTST